MNPALLLEHYARIADAPDAVARLRRFVLDLAVRGKLVEQNAGDEPASELLKQISAEKVRLARTGKIRKTKEINAIPEREIPFATPGGWEPVALGSVISLLSGQHLQPNEYSDTAEAGVPYITGPSDFTSNGLSISRYALVRKAVAHEGQLLLTVKGSGVGKATVCDLPEVAISRQLMALTPICWELGFLRLVTHLLAERLQEQARSLIPGISREDVDAFVFSLPPLAEQHRIVAKVDELMALCDQLEAARVNREAARDTFTLSTLAKLNTPDPATFGEDANFALANLAPLTSRPDQIKHLRQTILKLAVCGRLVESEASMRQGVLGQVGKFVGGSGFPKQFQGKQDMEIPFLKVSDMNLPGNERQISTANNYVSRDDLREMRAKAHPAGTIIFPKIGGAIATNKRRILGYPAAIDNNCAGQVPNDDVDVDWLYLVLSSVDMAAYQAGTAVPALNMKQLAEHPVAIPPKSEQYRIAAKVDELMALCDQLEASLITSEQTRSGLLEAVLHNALEPA